jgi:hypothetical protein
MRTWQDTTIFRPDTSIVAQDRYFAWVKDNVDFGVRARRVN